MSKVGYADVDYCDYGAVVYYNSDDGNNYDVRIMLVADADVGDDNNSDNIVL